jgi:hypothetical protein
MFFFFVSAEKSAYLTVSAFFPQAPAPFTAHCGLLRGDLPFPAGNQEIVKRVMLIEEGDG